MAKKTVKFEEAMDQLQAIVGALESGDMSLDESFAAYEKGVKLAAELKKMLGEGEARIVALKATLEGVSQSDISGEVE